jgi:hypothetical protein
VNGEGAAGLSARARQLTGVAGVLYGLLGIVLFVAPGWSAERFPWKVSDFVAMTIGGWALGAAGFCFLAVRDWRWSVVHPLLLFLWVFSISELLVVLWHRDGLVVDADHWLSIPYLVTLGVTGLAAVVGIADWVRLRPRVEPVGPPVPGWVRFFLWGFVLFLAVLVAATLWAPESALNGRVFPEPITPFTVRAFGVFYLSLGIAALPLLRARMGPVLAFLLAGEALVVPITAACFFHLDLFDDLDDHPLNALYLGAYLVAGVVAGLIILTQKGRLADGTGRQGP